MNGKICLVAACEVCRGTGTHARITATSVLQANLYGSSPVPVPCAACVQGYVFLPISEADLLERLLDGALSPDRGLASQRLREKFARLVVQVSEQLMLQRDVSKP